MQQQEKAEVVLQLNTTQAAVINTGPLAKIFSVLDARSGKQAADELNRIARDMMLGFNPDSRNVDFEDMQQHFGILSQLAKAFEEFNIKPIQYEKTEA